MDEWGAWYDVEPGTNPGFLYQQNTMRDALIAALTREKLSASDLDELSEFIAKAREQAEK